MPLETRAQSLETNNLALDQQTGTTEEVTAYRVGLFDSGQSKMRELERLATKASSAAEDAAGDLACNPLTLRNFLIFDGGHVFLAD